MGGGCRDTIRHPPNNRPVRCGAGGGLCAEKQRTALRGKGQRAALKTRGLPEHTQRRVWSARSRDHRDDSRHQAKATSARRCLPTHDQRTTLPTSARCCVTAPRSTPRCISLHACTHLNINTWRPFLDQACCFWPAEDASSVRRQIRHITDQTLDLAHDLPQPTILLSGPTTQPCPPNCPTAQRHVVL